MIKLDTFFTKERIVTANWGEISLIATDKHSNKKVSVAVCSFATGMIDQYPDATRDNAIVNVGKFKQYLIDNDIKTEFDWTNKASIKAKAQFARCFSMDRPFFSNER